MFREMPKWQEQKYDPKTGRFKKGHKPHNKGKKWSDYMSEESMEKSRATFIKNIYDNRGRKRPDVAKRCSRAVLGVEPSGKPHFFEGAAQAARIVSGTMRENIRNCCQGKRKTCGGWTWYYADDERVADVLRAYYE